MRVRFVTSLRRGGPVEHTLSLARAMAAGGVEVGVVCVSDDVADRFRSAGVEATVIPLRSWWDGRHALRAWRYVRGADVVHGQDRRSGLWVRLGPRPRRGGLRVYTVHGLPDEYLGVPGQGPRPGARAMLAYRGLDASLCRRADAVIAPSSAFAELLVARLGFPRAKLTVIPHGVDVPPRRVATGSLVGTVALLEAVKGLDVFLRSAARLADRDPEVRFAIFGSGPERERLEALAGRLGLSERVELPGYVPMTEALGRLALFVVSSYLESGPLTVLEAMAAGVPVVATRVGAIPEIAIDGTAQLVPPGDDAALADAIGRLLADPGLRERQAEAARDRVLARFTADASAAETLALYRRLLGDR
jgi:glycosyltransferase involved in cell wall biosynthesis